MMPRAIQTALLLLASAWRASAAHPPRERVPPALAAARAHAAILASFVCDAAAMPLHWEYNQVKIRSVVGDGDPAFHVPPLDLWYQGKLGGSTPYGQQNVAYLTVGAATGGFDPRAIEAAYFQIYNPATCPGPSGGVYLDASTKEFVANEVAGRHFPACGGDDDQADAAAHMTAVVALLAGNTSALLAALAPVIRVTQNTDSAVAFGSAAARVLEKLIVENTTALAALADTVDDLRDAARISPYAQDAALADSIEAALAAAARGEDPSAFILATGQSCACCAARRAGAGGPAPQNLLLTHAPQPQATTPLRSPTSPFSRRASATTRRRSSRARARPSWLAATAEVAASSLARALARDVAMRA